MYIVETSILFVFMLISALFIAFAWLFEKLEICDGYTLASALLASKLTAGAITLTLVCIVLQIARYLGLWCITLLGCVWFGVTVLTLAYYIKSGLERCLSVIRYYERFESSVLLSAEIISQHDFTNSASLVIQAKVAEDYRFVNYFSAKCKKFARKHGLVWEG